MKYTLLVCLERQELRIHHAERAACEHPGPVQRVRRPDHVAELHHRSCQAEGGGEEGLVRRAGRCRAAAEVVTLAADDLIARNPGARTTCESRIHSAANAISVSGFSAEVADGQPPDPQITSEYSEVPHRAPARKPSESGVSSVGMRRAAMTNQVGVAMSVYLDECTGGGDRLWSWSHECSPVGRSWQLFSVD